jgi:hypothetical protein
MKSKMLRAAMIAGACMIAVSLALPVCADEAGAAAKPEKKAKAAGEAGAKGNKHQVTGIIESIDAAAGTIAVKPTAKGASAETKTLKIDAACKFGTAEKKDATVADFKVGDKVVIQFEAGADGDVAKSIKIAQPPKPKEDKPKAAE